MMEDIINNICKRVNSLLYDDVIEYTIDIMVNLQMDLKEVLNISLTSVQKDKLKNSLLLLNSESIREALHKGELYITNDIINTKNKILLKLNVLIPEGHNEIDINDFKGYTW